MQHIPDSEFDRLFKDQLMDSEVQAPAGMWERIAPQIAPKKKRKAGLYWSTAATVLVALSAGLFFKPQEKIALHAPAVVTPADPTTAQPPIPDTKPETEASYADVAAGSKSNTDDQIFREDVVTAPVASFAAEEKSLSALQPVEEENHHEVSVAIEEPKLASTRKERNTITESVITNDNALAGDESTTTTAFDEPASEQPQLRPRIRNAGDLVNFVVDKLDKREQKFIEFRTDEDETSSLVAINIGPLKINQRRSK